MALFGRRRRAERSSEADLVAEADEYDDYEEYGDEDYEPATDGPFDDADAPDDGVSRLDLGSVRLPVPDGAQLQVEMDPSGPVRAVHVLTPYGQLTVNAYAAPRTGEQWKEVCGELAEDLRGRGAQVRSVAGEWGQELVASLGKAVLRFIGVDGPRWMLRGVVAGPPNAAEAGVEALRDMVRGTIVVRGAQPMPVRTPLPIELPEAMAKHVAKAQAGGGEG